MRDTLPVCTVCSTHCVPVRYRYPRSFASSRIESPSSHSDSPESHRAHRPIPTPLYPKPTNPPARLLFNKTTTPIARTPSLHYPLTFQQPCQCPLPPPPLEQHSTPPSPPPQCPVNYTPRPPPPATDTCSSPCATPLLLLYLPTALYIPFTARTLLATAPILYASSRCKVSAPHTIAITLHQHTTHPHARTHAHYSPAPPAPPAPVIARRPQRPTTPQRHSENTCNGLFLRSMCMPRSFLHSATCLCIEHLAPSCTIQNFKSYLAAP